MNSDLLDLDLPIFDDTLFPAPVLTLEQWLAWIDEVRRSVPADQFERWIHDERRCAVAEPFVM